MKVSEAVSTAGASLKSLVKIALLSRRPTVSRAPEAASRPLVILANGPSLRKTIAERLDDLKDMPTMAVNFAALADEFTQIRPGRYILADPHFFEHGDDKNVAALWRRLTAVDWPMTLYVDARQRRKALAMAALPSNVRVETFNAVGVEGWQWLETLAYRSRLAMPRPRNVLIPAIMTAIGAGFKEIYIAGADHSWLQSIWVTEDNEVVSVQPHFYKEDDEEKKRVVNEYKSYRLHQILESFRVAFESYHRIARYASRAGVRIYNSTPGSYIDAFERKMF